MYENRTVRITSPAERVNGPSSIRRMHSLAGVRIVSKCHPVTNKQEDRVGSIAGQKEKTKNPRNQLNYRDFLDMPGRLGFEPKPDVHPQTVNRPDMY